MRNNQVVPIARVSTRCQAIRASVTKRQLRIACLLWPRMRDKQHMGRVTHNVLKAAFVALALETACAQPNFRTEITGFWKGRVEFTYGRSKVAVKSLSKIERYSGEGFKITKALEHLNGRQKGFKNQTITYLYPSGRSSSVEYVDNRQVATGTGTWNISKLTLAIAETWQPWPTANHFYKMTSRHTLIARKKMQFNGTLSGGVRWSGAVIKTVDLN